MRTYDVWAKCPECGGTGKIFHDNGPASMTGYYEQCRTCWHHNKDVFDAGVCWLIADSAVYWDNASFIFAAAKKVANERGILKAFPQYNGSAYEFVVVTDEGENVFDYDAFKHSIRKFRDQLNKAANANPHRTGESITI